LRYGLTDDVELRLAGNGLTSTDDFPNSKTSVAPLILDTKVRLLNEQMDVFIPAAALEVYLQTNWGSKEFRGGGTTFAEPEPQFPVDRCHEYRDDTGLYRSAG
jgi:hypothetical protein